MGRASVSGRPPTEAAPKHGGNILMIGAVTSRAAPSLCGATRESLTEAPVFQNSHAATCSSIRHSATDSENGLERHRLSRYSGASGSSASAQGARRKLANNVQWRDHRAKAWNPALPTWPFVAAAPTAGFQQRRCSTSATSSCSPGPLWERAGRQNADAVGLRRADNLLMERVNPALRRERTMGSRVGQRRV